jgi:Tat protein secretion system quality control protein TatD with DNase activity
MEQAGLSFYHISSPSLPSKDFHDRFIRAPTKTATMTNAFQKSPCPCCSFDLFLPSSERNKDGDSPFETDVEQDVEIIEEDLDSAGQDAANQEPDPDDNNEDVCSCPLDVNQALEELFNNNDGQSPISIVDTHCHAQLNRSCDSTYVIKKQQHSLPSKSSAIRVLGLACSVRPDGFQTTLDFAQSSTCILPALGVHPWYLEGLEDDRESSSGPPAEHWLTRLEDLLIQHPAALVGEIGLCKMARWVRQHPGGKTEAMSIQRDVFKRQMKLAARLGRPVSVHVVNQHGVFVSVIREIFDIESGDDQCGLPPVIGMHSFTGTAHHVLELLKLEEQIREKRKGDMKDTGPIFYFGFSHAVNYAMVTSEKSRRKGRDAVRAVPADRIMAESDVHNAKDVLGGTVGAISYLAWVRQIPIRDMVDLIAKNGQSFLSGGTGT